MSEAASRPLSIYTTGYSGPKGAPHLDKAHLLLGLLERMNALLVDIRIKPASRWAPCWRKEQMQALYGRRYVHVADLGNELYQTRGESGNESGSESGGANGGAIRIANLERGLDKLDRLAQTDDIDVLLLLCGCEYATHCHRSTVAMAWAQRRARRGEECRIVDLGEWDGRQEGLPL